MPSLSEPLRYCPHGKQVGRPCRACEQRAALEREAAAAQVRGSASRAEAAGAGRVATALAGEAPAEQAGPVAHADRPSLAQSQPADAGQASSGAAVPHPPVGLHEGGSAKAGQEVPPPSFPLGPIWGTAQAEGARRDWRYRLCMHRQRDGEYVLTEQYLSADRARVLAERVVVEADGFDWVYDKLLEHADDRFGP